MPVRSIAGMGLSPRVRGNRVKGDNMSGSFGSIPACAGEPPHTIRYRQLHRVYPRVCGGTEISAASDCTKWGLSPRVRGNLDPNIGDHLGSGSIPACAGEPRKSRVDLALYTVYPRVCGGTWNLLEWNTLGAGLSPRVRGNLQVRKESVSRDGSIPACAGEPSGVSPVLPQVRVYPRVCGGTTSLACKTGENTGLSPRVRGNLIHKRA